MAESNMFKIADAYIRNTKTQRRSGNFFITDDKLYSHGLHWPLLLRTEQGFLLNESSRSQTTTKHRNVAAHALKLNGYVETGRTADTEFEFAVYTKPGQTS